MKQRFFAILLLVSLLLTGTIAMAEAPASFGQWLDDAVTSVETWVKDSGVLEARGQAIRTVAPDTASLQIGASIDKISVKDAQNEANRIISEVISALKDLGIADNQIATSGYAITQNYDYSKQPSVLVGYTARNTLTVTIRDFTLINDILDVAVEKGANDVGYMQFSYSDEGTVYKQALQEAILAAKEKAETMAETVGGQLYTLLELRESSQAMPYTNAVYAMTESGSVGTQIMSGEIAISANVVLIYQIK